MFNLLNSKLSLEVLTPTCSRRSIYDFVRCGVDHKNDCMFGLTSTDTKDDFDLLDDMKSLSGEKLYEACQRVLNSNKSEADIIAPCKNFDSLKVEDFTKCLAHSHLSLIFVDRIKERGISVDEIKKNEIKNNNKIIYHDSYILNLNCFKKQINKSEDSFDLTGDRGYLSKKMIEEKIVKVAQKEINGIKDFEVIVDIGGHDTEFVQMFDKDKEKIIVDINLVTPFLGDTAPKCEYIIGDAEAIFGEEEYLFEKLKKKVVLYSLNNFICSAKEGKGYKVLNMVADRMKKGDYLVITNLTASPIFNSGGFKRENLNNGFVKIKYKESYYRTAIDETHSFNLKNLKRIDNSVKELSLADGTEITLLLEDGAKITLPLEDGLKQKFRTILFVKE